VHGVYSVRPGITGEGQVNDINMSTPELLTEIDDKMIRELNLMGHFKFIFQTVQVKCPVKL
jgi:O-antigen biosynthesis protein WbqP